MSRRLTAGEQALARSVFGDLIDPGEVRLAEGGFGGFAVTLGPLVAFPLGKLEPDFACAALPARAWLVHELTHVWQWRTRPLRTAVSWARTVATGGYGPGLPGYAYALPLRPFAYYGLEQQASIVEHAYRLREGGAAAGGPAGARYADYAGRTPIPGLAETVLA